MKTCWNQCCHFCRRKRNKGLEGCLYSNIKGTKGCPLSPLECQSRVDAFFQAPCKLFRLDQEKLDRQMAREADLLTKTNKEQTHANTL